MPPLLSQKGTGKKKDPRQSRSRNTTPSLLGSTSAAPPTQTETKNTKFLDLKKGQFRLHEELAETYSPAIPSSKELDALIEQLESLKEAIDIRGAVVDKGMRLLAQSKKDIQEEVENVRRDEERKERMKRDAADEEERGRKQASKMKKRKELSTAREERPLNHGAHVMAPQDGSNLEVRIPSLADAKPARRLSGDNDSASSSLSPAAPLTPGTNMDIDEKPTRAVEDDDDDSSSDGHQPRPAPAIPHLQTFGDDPFTFSDPTVYEIRKDVAHLSREEQKKIYSVSYFPTETLEDLIPGSPPDMDFSNGKATNQVQATTFQTYLDGFFRNITEEDLAFLRDRGDRVGPFIIPRRGKEHYTEKWAREDGALSVDTPQQGHEKYPLNQPRGSIEDINDATAETDQFSAGPMLNRLLSLMRPEHRAPPSEEKPTANGLTNGESNINGESNVDELSQILGTDTPAPLPSATYMPESNTEAWKKATHPKLDYAQIDERIKQELRYVGFLGPETEPEYDEHLDDEVTARLRYLQEQLKERSIKNGAMKARLMDLAKSAMASQEYNNICEDLDGQVQTAYLKRTRTLGKSKKAKRPGGAGGGSHFVGGAAAGMARPGIGDVTRTLMDRRQKWKDTVGPVLDPEVSKIRRSKDPDSSIFKPGDMAEYVRRERESWDEEAEEE